MDIIERCVTKKDLQEMVVKLITRLGVDMPLVNRMISRYHQQSPQVRACPTEIFVASFTNPPKSPTTPTTLALALPQAVCGGRPWELQAV